MAIQTTINPNGIGTSFSGPVMVGPRAGANNSNSLGNQGFVVLQQSKVINFNGANNVSATFNLPKHSQMTDIISDTTTAWNSATSDTLSVGTSAGDTTYASGVDVKGGAARIRPTFTAAQLAAMQDIGTTEAVVATVTINGTPSAGSTTVTVQYIVTQNRETN